MMTDDKRVILEAVVRGGLDKALNRHVSPPILGALTSLGWTEESLGKYLGVSNSRICQMMQGHTGVPGKRIPQLYHLLGATLKQYDQEIERLQEAGEWSLSAASWLRYRIGNAKGVLTRYRRRSKLAA